LKEWSKFYRDQIGTANKLLKEYPAEAIINALNSRDAYSIYSLRAPFLRGIIQVEKDKLKPLPTIVEVNEGDILAKPKEAFHKKSSLRDL
jgi:hypothetical protein